MSLDKAIESGKEHRRRYYGSKAFDYTCRPHGGRGKRHCAGQCTWCMEDRLHQRKREELRVESELEASR